MTKLIGTAVMLTIFTLTIITWAQLHDRTLDRFDELGAVQDQVNEMVEKHRRVR